MWAWAYWQCWPHKVLWLQRAENLITKPIRGTDWWRHRSSLFTLHKKKQDDSLPSMSHTSTSCLNSFHEQSQNSNFTFKNSREKFPCIILDGRVWSSQRWELWDRLFDRITYICPSFDSMPNQRKETYGCEFKFKHHANVTPHFRGVTLWSTRLMVWSQINLMVRNTF